MHNGGIPLIPEKNASKGTTVRTLLAVRTTENCYLSVFYEKKQRLILQGSADDLILQQARMRCAPRLLTISTLA
jgi:hypothetical protein